ncbi:MAG: hypothetical protein ACSHWW_00460 [Nonlabens sp.]|uniref:hypothetical protein n=1 Tax=Nonlabens sp. TaxID=1888209 RepID=UPI003EF49C9A
MYLSTNHQKKPNSTWISILKELEGFDDFLIVTKENGDYVQCIRDNEKIIVEYRKHDDYGFKHYVIGNKILKKHLKTSWVILNTSSGIISVQKDEILKIEEVIFLFKEFYDFSSIPKSFNLRNITKLFT